MTGPALLRRLLNELPDFPDAACKGADDADDVFFPHENNRTQFAIAPSQDPLPGVGAGQPVGGPFGAAVAERRRASA